MAKIVNSGLTHLAQAQAGNATVNIDKFIYANIPGLDFLIEVPGTEVMPNVANIVHESAVSNKQFVSASAVLYSNQLAANVGDFLFNWIGLYDTDAAVLVAVAYVPTQSKWQTTLSRSGNILVKNFAIQYSNMAELAGINIEIDPQSNPDFYLYNMAEALVADAIAAHVAEEDPHPVYMTEPKMNTALESKSTFNLLANGDFTKWLNSMPDRWTASGGSFNISKVNNFFDMPCVKLVPTSADIAWLTQPAMRGSINYWRGRILTFSAWVFSQSIGAIKLHVEGQNPVSNTLVNTWELLKTTSTMSSGLTRIPLAHLELCANKQDVETYVYGTMLTEGNSGFVFSPELKDGPTGGVIPFPVSSPPTGYLECNGAAVSRTVYAALFAVISTVYGVGDGTTTFNIPDYRGAFLRHYLAGTTNGFGTVQSDAFQGHKHYSNASRTVMGQGTTFADRGDTTEITANASLVGEPYEDGTNGTPRISSETRPVNYAIKYCIKY